MYTPMTAVVGNSRLCFHVQTAHLNEWIARRYNAVGISDQDDLAAVDLHITVYDFYGTFFDEKPAVTAQEGDQIVYSRADYKLEVTSDYRRAVIRVFDNLALKHAMMNLYSAYLIHHQQGLLVHSSCVVQDGKAWIFSGDSGAGKSTVAQLSEPRPVLSDEATYLHLEEDGSVTVFDSPFRSDSDERCEIGSSKLGGIHFLNQSMDVKRTPISKSDTLFNLLNKIFYWKHDRAETAKMLALCSAVVASVPAYQLYFQKNDSFWERIS